MDYRQLQILFFLAVILCSLSGYQTVESLFSQNVVKSSKNLCWDGKDLILTETECAMSGNNDIPAASRPLFFKKIPINKANYELLVSVPGIGPATAVQILNFRESRGKIDKLNDLLQISGIGEKKLKKFQNHLTL